MPKDKVQDKPVTSLKDKPKRVKRDKKSAPKQKKEKKPGTPFKGAVVMLLFFLLLFGAAYGVFYFNWFDARGLTAGWLGVTDETSQRKEAQLTDWETSLQSDAQKLADDQKNVKTAQDDVTAREAAVKTQEDDLATKLAAYQEMDAQLQAKNDDITSVVKIIESMSADTAAAMLTAMTDKTVMLSAFSKLKPATQAAILETMDAKAAATLVESLG